MQVNFLIAGTQKGGTSALAAFLSGHPQIVMAARKELHFFDDEKLFRSRPQNELYATYRSQFPPEEHSGPVGEATPIYMFWKPAAKRIWDYNPSMKLICLLRNPVARAYSHYAMQRGRGIEPLTFAQAIRAERFRALRSFPRQQRKFSYVSRGLYSVQIGRLLRFFPRRQMLFLKSEDLRQHHSETMNRVYEFLEVDTLQSTAPEEIFASKYESPLSEADRAFLQSTFAREITRLERLLDWDCSDWIKGVRTH